MDVSQNSLSEKEFEEMAKRDLEKLEKKSKNK